MGTNQAHEIMHECEPHHHLEKAANGIALEVSVSC
jgi:hypothetical protein